MTWEGAEGETLHPLGFISSDFICGIAKESQKGKDRVRRRDHADGTSGDHQQ